MAFATGLFKKLTYKKEVTWNTPPAAAGAQAMRRVTSAIEVNKPGFVSPEITTELQIRDLRLGAREAGGAIKGLLVPQMWQDFIAAALRKVFVGTTAMSALTITIAGAGPTYTVTRSAGSYLTDGVKIGDVVRLTAGAFNAANLNLNLGVLNVTATVLTVIPLNGAAMVAEGPIATSTVSVPGKRCWTPTSAHTDDSFSVEHWFSDVNQSEVFSGLKVDSLALGFPTSGAATCDMAMKGGGVTPAQAQYFTSPTAAPTWGVLHAVNGVLRYGNANVANVTGLTLNYGGQVETKAVVGAATVAGAFPHMPRITGQMTALFQDRTYLDAFLNETVMSLTAWAAAGTGAAADFMGFTLSQIKATDSNKNDGEGPIEATIPFQALYNGSGGAGQTYEQSTLVVQDSQAV